MQNLALVVKVRQAEAVVKVRAKAAGQAARAKDRAEEAKKSTMDMLLTHSLHRGLGLVDQSGALQKGENPLIRDPENPEIQAKASDLVEDLAYSAIILVGDT